MFFLSRFWAFRNKGVQKRDKKNRTKISSASKKSSYLFNKYYLLLTHVTFFVCFSLFHGAQGLPLALASVFRISGVLRFSWQFLVSTAFLVSNRVVVL
jgi:hypothetical protein